MAMIKPIRELPVFLRKLPLADKLRESPDAGQTPGYAMINNKKGDDAKCQDHLYEKNSPTMPSTKEA